jgi:hypothetical protein
MKPEMKTHRQKPGKPGRRGRLAALMAWACIGLALNACEMAVEPVDVVPSRILLQEDFSANASNWFTGTLPGSYDFEIGDGEYFLRSLNDSGIAVSKAVPIPAGGDFDIEADFRLYGTEADLGYGLCWGGREGGDRFCFFLSKDRKYTLFKRSGGTVSDYIPWTPSAAVDSLRNSMVLRKRGTTIRAYLNGKEAGAIPYEPFFGDRIGFAGDGKQDFAVEDLIIRIQ